VDNVLFREGSTVKREHGMSPEALPPLIEGRAAVV
jgi:hypothetical protein